jgi:glucose/arabinose dehydrogenase
MDSKFLKLALLIAGFMLLPACGSGSEAAQAQEMPFDWRADWGVEKGFNIEIDTEGYSLPTGLAFVPNPGSRPKDPLYFVTEVRGTIKVITNDRSIYTFAKDFFTLTPKAELPSGQGQVGMAGICLAPKQGYVFATFAYQDENGVLRNNIVRFQSEAETFSLEPTDQVEFTDIFLPYDTGLAHHIGPCQVKDEALFVSVGEGWKPFKTTLIDQMYGKVIRMSLEGKPLPDNPYYQDDEVSNAANYVWAYGFRNPFGLTLLDDRIFVADNGQNIDRFLEVDRGKDYFWNGSDRSIAANADFVIVPSLGPVNMDYYSPSSSLFPDDYAGNFFISLSAMDKAKGKIPGIFVIPYDLEVNRVSEVPRYFLKFRSDGPQMVTGLVFGPDGLYFSPLHPNQEGLSPVLKITYDPQTNYPYDVIQTEDPMTLMHERGCLGCHSLNDNWGYVGGTAGPLLDRDPLVDRLDQRLNNQAYVESLQTLDNLDIEPIVSYKDARHEVATAAEGIDRIHTWIKYRIQEPRFDNQYSQMPNLGVTEKEATIIADFLLKEKAKPSLLSRFLPVISGRHLALAFVAGFFAPVCLGLVWRFIKFFISGKRSQAA